MKRTATPIPDGLQFALEGGYVYVTLGDKLARLKLN